MANLMEQLNKSQVHFIRCLKPNEQQRINFID